MINIISVLILMQPIPQPGMTVSVPVVGQLCQVLSNGNIIVTPNIYYGTVTLEKGPNKITLAIDLPKDTQICNETKSGAICKTVDELFKVK